MGQSAEGMEHRAEGMEDSAKSTELIEFGKRQVEKSHTASGTRYKA